MQPFTTSCHCQCPTGQSPTFIESSCTQFTRFPLQLNSNISRVTSVTMMLTHPSRVSLHPFSQGLCSTPFQRRVCILCLTSLWALWMEFVFILHHHSLAHRKHFLLSNPKYKKERLSAKQSETRWALGESRSGISKKFLQMSVELPLSKILLTDQSSSLPPKHWSKASISQYEIL